MADKGLDPHPRSPGGRHPCIRGRAADAEYSKRPLDPSGGCIRRRDVDRCGASISEQLADKLGLFGIDRRNDMPRQFIDVGMQGTG